MRTQFERACDFRQYPEKFIQEMERLSPSGYWALRLKRECPSDKQKSVQTVLGSIELGSTKYYFFADIGFNLVEPLINEGFLTAVKIVVDSQSAEVIPYNIDLQSSESEQQCM